MDVFSAAAGDIAHLGESGCSDCQSGTRDGSAGHPPTGQFQQPPSGQPDRLLTAQLRPVPAGPSLHLVEMTAPSTHPLNGLKSSAAQDPQSPTIGSEHTPSVTVGVPRPDAASASRNYTHPLVSPTG